jgi:hypothetical protein
MSLMRQLESEDGKSEALVSILNKAFQASVTIARVFVVS